MTNENNKIAPPVKSIRSYCLSCCGDSSNEVLLCACNKCTLFPYRRGKKNFESYEGEKLTPVKAIRERCIDCHAGQLGQVMKCPIQECALYPYRMGKAPNRKRELTDEQKQVLKERFAQARAKI